MTLNGKVMRQSWTEDGVDHVIDFAYGNTGSPYAFTYDGTTYYYVLNQQGDVIRIVNKTGTTVAEYLYVAWGNLLVPESSLTTIGKINPIRYRGYYYDTETGFYYLQSRYYDPSIGRFINADSFASTGQDFLGYNMFAYCNNNPMNYADKAGDESEEVVDTDGDGVVDYYVYTYTYTTGILAWKKEHTGYVYIYVGKATDFFEDPSNKPEGFSSDTNIMIGDYTSSSNPNMYAYRADLTDKKHRKAILSCMLQYDEDFDTAWNRTLDSLVVEWREHKRYAWASARAKNIDFDNAEEGAGFFHYLHKAVVAFLN